jgi:hypothetical protein
MARVTVMVDQQFPREQTSCNASAEEVNLMVRDAKIESGKP